MVHNRRARPTLRVLREDLTSSWASPEVHRALNEGRVRELGALSELPHPVLAKCLAHFGSDGPMRTPEGLIRSASQYPMWEVKVGQWRAGVWRDPATGVHWLLAAGLAKGGHGDGDDFYQRVMRVHSAKRADTWLPTQEDAAHLKAETAARLLTEWELGIQKSALRALEAVHGGGDFSFDLRHPIEERVEPGHAHMASVTVTVDLVRQDDYSSDDVVVDMHVNPRWAGSDLWWRAAMRILISIDPPEQGWDTYQESFSTIGEPGAWTARIETLRTLVDAGVLSESVPGSYAHFAHKRHLAGNTIEGHASRALCGVFFVPTQDHATLPQCPRCGEEYTRLPQ